jgi:acyl-CoA thioesterase FadM
VVWLREPQIGEPIRLAAQEVGLPVHEAQHFDYVRPLEIDSSYDLMLELKRENNPARLIATAEIFEPGGVFVARVVTILRLIDPADARNVWSRR